MVGQPLCLVAGARAGGGWRVVFTRRAGRCGLAAGVALGSARLGRARMLCAVPSRLRKLRGGEKIKDAGREASCLSYTSPRRAGDRSAVRPSGARLLGSARTSLGVLPVHSPIDLSGPLANRTKLNNCVLVC